MPAIITHHLFGEDAAKLLPKDIVSDEEELLAFLLGNQGPDPLFACISTFPEQAKLCHKLGWELHEHKIVDAFWVLRDAVSHLRCEDERIGLAWSLGYLGHYALDSAAHPLIYAQQDELARAAYGLEDASEEIHALLESEIDVWMLRQLRGINVTDVPTYSYLARTERISQVAGALMAQVGLQVYGLPIGVAAYGGAVADYELVYRFIEPAGSMHKRLATKIEQLIRPNHYSRILAMTHVVSESDACAAANLEQRRWINPADGKPRTESFPDLYHLGLERWKSLSHCLSSGDRKGFAQIVDSLNFDGKPDMG